MIAFALVAVGYLVGCRVRSVVRHRGHGHRWQQAALLGSVLAGGVSGVAAWRATANTEYAIMLADLQQLLHPMLGDLADALLALLVILVLVGVFYGVCVSAAFLVLVLGLLFGALVGSERDPDPRRGPEREETAREIAVSAYGGAVAKELHHRLGKPVRLELCRTEHPHVHLEAEGVAARWDDVGGWSANTLRGRHWYPHDLVPGPGRIALWLSRVGTAPRLGVGRLPERDGDLDEHDLVGLLLTAAAPARRGAHDPALDGRLADASAHRPGSSYAH
ncbi:hypothetical protein SUDANB95_08009 (plasmid) [Actinosynnema sp. ALI-1.44]